MIRTLLLGLVALIALTGCGTNPGQTGGGIQVDGKVTFSDGKPVSLVLLQLQPTGDGFPARFRLGEGGTFKGEVVPGKYTYYFEPAGNAEAFQRIPAKYREAHLDRQMRIGSGALEIKLD